MKSLRDEVKNPDAWRSAGDALQLAGFEQISADCKAEGVPMHPFVCHYFRRA